MGLLWIEGFETFGTSSGSTPTGILEKYITDSATTSGLTIEDGRVGGKSIKITNASRTFTTPSFGNKSTIVVGIAFKCLAHSSSTTDILRIMDGGSTTHISLQNVVGGELRVLLGTSTTIATTTGLSLPTGVWCYIELKVTIGDSGSGSYELRVNGVNVLSGSVDTRNGGNATCDRVMFKAGASGTSFQYDDIYIIDTAGSLNTNFLGSQKIVAIFPNGAGDSTQFTPSTGSNYAAVDENPPNDDTDYVESGTSSHLDLYNFQDTALVNIKGVQINARVRETDGTPFSVHLVAKSGSTQSDGSALAIGSTSYLTRSRILETNPDTTAAWSDSEIDSAQFGVKVA